MKRRISAFLSLFLLALAVMAEGKAKYVFYFIGDGMGVNQVNAAETYLGALDGRIGITPLCFPSFPFSAFVNTQSATNGVTDSAAAGTALATGNKTKNGALGVLKDLTTPVNSIAQWAHDAGAAVGITTSVFSLCTAFQYLGGVMLPGMVSGWISDKVGYVQFFWLVMAFCLVTFAVTALVHLPEEERR